MGLNPCAMVIGKKRVSRLISDTIVRPVAVPDIDDVMRLYRALSAIRALPEPDVAILYLDRVLSHPGTTIWGAEVAGHLKAMCTLHVLPNISNGGQPYALIENVVTLPDMRRQGLAHAVMKAAINAAFDDNCYKVMLLSGSDEGRAFYKAIGFDDTSKTGMVIKP